MIVTVLNYEIYQDLNNYRNDGQNDTTVQTRTTQERHTNDTINKNGNNGKNDNNDIIYIVDYLNGKCGTKFKSSTQNTKSHIKARFREGFKVDDFVKVIDSKFDKWGTDVKMMEYLRPKTLFGTNMEDYLNVATKIQPDAFDFLKDENGEYLEN